MNHTVYKSNSRRLAVKNYLQAHGLQSLQEMKDGYLRENKVFPFAESEDEDIYEWLLLIEGVYSMDVNGVLKFFMFDTLENAKKAEKRQALLRIDNERSRLAAIGSQHATPSVSLFVTRAKSTKIPLSGKGFSETVHPTICSTLLFGDDNFLNIALYDLGFERNLKRKRRQRGFCVSGLRLPEASKMLDKLDEGVNRIIVNVGTIDILEGRSLDNLVNDFLCFLSVCASRNISPIITTLTPLVHPCGEKKLIVEGFNHFLRHSVDTYTVIDLHKYMMLHPNAIDTSLYLAEPSYMTGSKKTLVMWNAFGRRLVYKLMVKKIAQTLIRL